MWSTANTRWCWSMLRSNGLDRQTTADLLYHRKLHQLHRPVRSGWLGGSIPTLSGRLSVRGGRLVSSHHALFLSLLLGCWTLYLAPNYYRKASVKANVAKDRGQSKHWDINEDLQEKSTCVKGSPVGNSSMLK